MLLETLILETIRWVVDGLWPQKPKCSILGCTRKSITSLSREVTLPQCPKFITIMYKWNIMLFNFFFTLFYSTAWFCATVWWKPMLYPLQHVHCKLQYNFKTTVTFSRPIWLMHNCYLVVLTSFLDYLEPKLDDGSFDIKQLSCFCNRSWATLSLSSRRNYYLGTLADTEIPGWVNLKSFIISLSTLSTSMNFSFPSLYGNFVK